jgi:hypothetical protein
MLCRQILICTSLLCSATIVGRAQVTATASGSRPASQPASAFGEREVWLRFDPGVRVLINMPVDLRSDRPAELIVYALPNGNTIEWTAGKRVREGDDWHFGIQHVAAQTRRLREVVRDRDIVVAYLEADGRSWPGWKQKHPDYPALIPRLVERIAAEMPAKELTLHLTGHSGGGSLVFGYLDGVEEIPARVTRISFLDSNYAYSDERAHGDKLLKWLRGSPGRMLAVICYDDRHITLNGKPVLKSPLGGTWGSTQRMKERLARDVEFDRSTFAECERLRGLGGQIDILIHPNPQNRILHTELVRWNGLLHVATTHTPYEGKAAVFNGPIAYEAWIAN